MALYHLVRVAELYSSTYFNPVRVRAAFGTVLCKANQVELANELGIDVLMYAAGTSVH